MLNLKGLNVTAQGSFSVNSYCAPLQVSNKLHYEKESH